MSAASRDSRPGSTNPLATASRWLPALAGAITALAIVLLILTGHTELIGAVAALGVAITGGTAIKVNIHIRR